MIIMLRSRKLLYTREEPTKDAKLIIIYCEGKKREKQYFNYFSEISSKIRLEVEAPSQHDNTSPNGLYKKAVGHIIDTSNPKYEKDDEVWFVIDTDEWGRQIEELRANCLIQENWSVAQSNPCFEVWLFYHLFPFESFDKMKTPKGWKQYLNGKLVGGFDSKKHSILIKTAIENAKSKFDETMDIGSTEIFKLAESFYPFVEDKIEEALRKIEVEIPNVETQKVIEELRKGINVEGFSFDELERK